jgi:filamentous hemagglutinin family protein
MSRLPSKSMRRGVRTVASAPAFAGFRPAAAALAVATAFTLQPQGLHAQPVGPQVIHGQASFQRSGTNLLVTTQNGAGTSHSAINWQSFSVPGGSVTQFIQPSAASTSINRVLGPDPSAIFGTLSSNGRIVLVNPAGIAVGQGALVDTAGFTASTLRMSDADAIAGRLFFSGDSAGALQVDGQIIARNGDVVLIAPKVQTGSDAVIQSQGGATVLAAGQKVSITGRGLEGIHLEVQAGNEAVNLGTLKGDAVGIFANTLKHSGVIAAQVVSTEGGKVVLKAIGGDALVDGTIMAKAGDKGGSIDLLGERVGLLAGANLDASGTAGGGQVRIGGDYQGLNADVSNAKRTYVDAGAIIKADATGQGDGGRVIVWSDEVTRMYGQISARGGAQGGNGGFAEVSGKQYLDFGGLVDLRAPNGTNGMLLLDPEDITIVRSDATTSTNTFPIVSTDSFPQTNTSNSPTKFEPSSTGPVTLTDTQLNNQLGYSDVLVKTSSTVSTGTGGQITVNADAVVNWTSDSSLTLKADKGITVNGTIWNSTSGVAGVHLYALSGAIQINPNASVTAANVEMVTQPGHNIEIEGAGVWATQGNVSIQSGGDVQIGTQEGTSSYRSTTVDAAKKLSIKAAGKIMAGVAATATYPSYVSLTGGGGAGNGVLLKAGSDIDLSLNTSVTGYYSPIVLNAGGNIVGSAYFNTNGSAAGSVSMTAGGSISFGTIDTSGNSDGGGLSGGDVTLTATSGNVMGQEVYTIGGANYDADGAKGGNLTVTATKSTVAIGYIYTNGGDSYEGSSGAGVGGNSGAVTINAGTGISLDGVDTSGGNSYGGTSGPNAGGAAGSVTLNTFSGTVQIGYLAAEGGEGSQGASGGTVTVVAPGDVRVAGLSAAGGESVGNATGGQGGAVRIVAGGNLVLTSPYGGGVSAFGGDSTAGVGGRGGVVDVIVGGGILVVPDSAPVLTEATTSIRTVSSLYGLAAAGGTGGSSANGLAGGQGGDLRITGTGSSLVLDSSLTLYAAGGDGGTYTASGGVGGVGGVGGNGGTITIQSAGTVNLRSPQLYAGGGQGGSDVDYVAVNGASGTLGNFTAMGTSVEVESDLTLYANWTNSSIVNIRGSSVVSGPGVFRNASDLKLYDTAQLLMASVENAGRMTSFGANSAYLTQNTGLLEVVAGSSLSTPLFYSNSGTVQVDGTLTIGSQPVASSTTTAPLDTAASSLTGGTFTNSASGLLSGNGSIIVDGGSGTLDNFGTIAPGGVGSVGTLAVSGNLVMEAGSTYAADVLNTSSHDLLKVDGLATTGGGFAVTYLSGASFSAGQTFPMLQASGLTATSLPTVDKTELTATATTTELQLLAVAPYPTPAPAPAPAPVTTTEEQAAEVVINQVTQFAQLFLEEAQQQQEEEKKETQIGKDDIVVTDTACK